MSWFTDQAPTLTSQAGYLPPNGNTGFTGTGGGGYLPNVTQDLPTTNAAYAAQNPNLYPGDPATGAWNDFPTRPSGGILQPQTGTGYLGGSSTFNEAGSSQPTTNTTGGTSYAVTGNQNDPAYIGQWLKGQGVQDKDIAYYTQKIQGVGGLGDGKWWSEQIHSTAPGAQSAGGFSSSNSPLLAPYGQTFQGGGPVPQFNAPSGLDLANDPGYQARMKMGADAIQNSAAAKGKLLTGGTLKDLTQYGQDFGSNEYSNVFNRALSAYGANLTGQNQGFNQAYNTFGANYDIFRNNQTDPFNKLYSLSNLGFNAANSANNAGNQYGNNLGQNSTSYTGIGQHSADNVGSTQIGQGNVNGTAQIQQGNNNGAYIQQAGQLATDPAIMGWFQKHWFGQPSSGTTPTTDAGNY